MANPTDLEICNLALLTIGEEQIGSLSESSRPARICNAFYDIIVKEIIQEFNWNELKKSATLTVNSTETDYDYENRYVLPSDCIRVLHIQQDDLYEISGDSLYTDADSPIELEYIHFPSDTSLFSPLFIEILYLSLALKLVVALTGGDLSLVNFIENKIATSKAKAFSISSMQNNIDDGSSDWINARGGIIYG